MLFKDVFILEVREREGEREIVLVLVHSLNGHYN